MSNELQTILNDIKDQKDNYLKPENIVEGVELLGVKGNLKLPKPIYNTTSYRTLTIPSPDTSKYTQIYMLYSLGDYIIVSWKTSSYGSNYYLYRKVNNQYELLGDTKIGSPTSYATNAVICSYNDNYVYIAQGQRNSKNYTLATFNIVNKSVTSKSVSTSFYTSNFVWSDINGYFMSARISSGYLYKLNGTSSSPSTTTLNSFPNCEYVYNKMLRIFGYSSTAITKLSFDNGTPIQTSATAPKNIKGVNYYGNKIFLADGIYQLSEQLTIGEKLNDINITKSKIYPLNDKYYMSSASSNKVVLYEFDEDTNLFKEVETISSTCANGGYETSATLFGLNYIYDFTQGDTLLGYEIDNQNVYLNTLRQISTDSILSGYSAYNFSGNPIVGTMPNNGELTYNPSIANQSIPKGYTDGGTILGVTNEIDSNIQPENIKKDVVILNVTGTYEGIMTQEDYDTCEQIADEILSGNFPYNYIEYIEFNGNQYTTLPYYFTNNMSYEITFQDLGSPTWTVWLGNGAETVQLQYEDISGIYVNRGGGADNGDYVMSDLDVTTINTYKQDLANFYINGELRLTLGEGTTFTSNNKINIGVVGPTNSTRAKMKLFGLKLWDNNELICNLVPVRRLTDNVAGLYDKVNDIFYTSLTTTAFISGGDL